MAYLRRRRSFGLVIGSFLNVCIYRLPRDQSVVWPASRCTDVRARDRAGTRTSRSLSYAGASRPLPDVRRAISVMYPLVELLTAGVFVATYAAFGPAWLFPIRAVFGCAMIVLLVIDLQHQILPERDHAPRDRRRPGGEPRGRAGLARRAHRRRGRRRRRCGSSRGPTSGCAHQEGLGLRRREDAGDDRRVPRVEADAAHAGRRVAPRVADGRGADGRAAAPTGSRSCRSARSWRSAPSVAAVGTRCSAGRWSVDRRYAERLYR